MAPKTKKQFAAMRQQSIAAIKEAALELFSVNGYGHTSIARIAKEAGISKGLMYNYFESKTDLLRAIVSDAISMGETMLREGLSTSSDPRQQLRNLIEVTFATVQANKHYWKLITSLAFQQEVFASIEDLVGEKNLQNLLGIVPIFEQLGYANPEKEALLMGAAMDGIFMGYIAMGDQYPIDDMKEHLISRFIQTKDNNQ
jgi:AcrR family transcriptional regulator